MMMRAPLVALLISSHFAGPAAPGPQPAVVGLKERLVGSWRLLAYDKRLPSGETIPAFGPAPRGRLVYDSGGRMSVQLMDPRRKNFASGDSLRGTPQEVKEAFEGYFAYFGTYTLDEQAGTVTHHVEGCSFPNYIGTHQKRFVALSSDGLTLRTPPELEGGAKVTFEVRWERER